MLFQRYCRFHWKLTGSGMEIRLTSVIFAAIFFKPISCPAARKIQRFETLIKTYVQAKLCLFFLTHFECNIDTQSELDVFSIIDSYW